MLTWPHLVRDHLQHVLPVGHVAPPGGGVREELGDGVVRLPRKEARLGGDRTGCLAEG